MNAAELKTRQAPLKAAYQQDPASACLTLSAVGELAPGEQTVTIRNAHTTLRAGLHPAAGGNGEDACSGEMLLEALIACAGVTLQAVATAMGIALRAGQVRADGELDFRGTLGVSKDAPVGFAAIRLTFALDTDASNEQLATLLRLSERYCVIYQSLKQPPQLAWTRLNG